MPVSLQEESETNDGAVYETTLLLPDFATTGFERIFSPETPRAAKGREQRIAVIICLGLGVTTSYYIAAAGFLVERLKLNMLFWMMVALYSMYPLICIMQGRFDAYFDRRFSVERVYVFRVMICPLLLAIMFVILALRCLHITDVLVCGVFIGIFAATSLSSTLQLLVAWRPELSAWAGFGSELGSALPVLTYGLFGFRPSKASVWDFQVMQIFPTVCLAISGCLTLYWHFGLDLFSKSLARLNCNPDHEFAPKRQGIQRTDADECGIPLWTYRWQVCSGINALYTFMLIPLTMVFDDPDWMQALILAQQVCNFLGQLIAALLASFAKENPLHILLTIHMLLRSILFATLLATMFKLMSMSRHFFMIMWCIHLTDGALVASQIEVTCARFAPTSMRRRVSRQTTLSIYAGVTLALSVDAFWVLSH